MLNAAAPRALARFYAELLGWMIEAEEPAAVGEPDEAGWAIVLAPDRRLKIEVQWDLNYQSPVWSSQHGAPSMIMHLDFAVDDLEAAVARSLELGASLAEHQPQTDVRVMVDPEGHPFCLFEQ